MLTNLSEGSFTPREELEDRINQLRKNMERAGIAFSIILQNVDLFYFAGTVQKGVLVVSVDNGPLLFIERNVDRAAVESGLEIIPIKRDKDVGEILMAKGILKGKCGMEFDVVPVSVFERWKSIVGLDDFTDIWPAIRDLRIIKSPFEIEQVKRSGSVCDHVFEKARDVVREGAREVDIAAFLEAEGRRVGHQGFLRMRGLNQEMMNLYITHGRSGTIPSSGDVPIAGAGVTHAIAQGPSLNKVEKGVPVVIDYGGGYNGYITDETRTFVVGELKERFKKPYEVAKEIVEDATVYGKEGIDGTELFLRAEEKAKKAGLDEYFMGFESGKVTFIGHGLGLEINELPVITPRHHIILKEGMVFAFEPKFIFPGEGAIGVEVDYVVRKDKLERVTRTSIDLVTI
ncbi:MAG TPA: Xaa-Pro peptidase family protein [Syntrophorhabdus sp.]|jgi:Xaa-Pro aminopeptidase|nr:aminopeptidase P family protein [Syntrophorhabdus sp.]MDI9559209.1 Xaa-Pro peptidase family protein [Pseudomonadota bacterium]OQB76974.1 MAG: Xaa-Pro dipeptidase [Deltaproteobacteria bacterium ADurb.Bin135]MBP8743598.1 aminopeptidase P family protein [Syntrophorhabdus sp.]NMC93988.1 aminopeptidase P family protein [Syntrophorhabdus sp.]